MPMYVVLTDLAGHLRWGISGVGHFTAELGKCFQLQALRRYFAQAVVMVKRRSIRLFLSPVSILTYPMPHTSYIHERLCYIF